MLNLGFRFYSGAALIKRIILKLKMFNYIIIYVIISLYAAASLALRLKRLVCLVCYNNPTFIRI